MSEVTVTGQINAAADDVWASVGDFSGIHKFVSAITNVTMASDTERSCALGMGGATKDILDSRNDENRTLVFHIEDPNPLPFENYVSTMVVRDAGQGSEFEWSATFEPSGMAENEVVAMLTGLYEDAVQSLKKLHEPA